MDAMGKNNYGKNLYNQISSIKKRMVNSLNYQINKNNQRINVIDKELSSGNLSENDMRSLRSEKSNLSQQNSRYSNVLSDISKVK